MAKKKQKENCVTKLDSIRLGLGVGKVCALLVFLMTIVGIYNPGYAQTWHNFVLEIYGFLGYDLTWFGAILGAIYGFIDGFILGWLVAFFYNRKWICSFKK